MAILTEENINTIFDELEKRIKNSAGIKICVNKPSVNFESWVQVELCNILNSKEGLNITLANITVESRDGMPKKKYIDVLIRDELEMPLTAIAIKIIKLAPEGAINEEKKCFEDITTLNDCGVAEKALLYVVYEAPCGERRKKTWSDVRKKMKCQGDAPERSFGLVYDNDGHKTNVYLELIKV